MSSATVAADTESRAPRRTSRPQAQRADRRTEKMIYGSISVIVLLAMWELLTALKIEPSILLPSPLEVVRALGDMFASPTIWLDLGASGGELLYGFLLAAVVGIVVGLAIGWYRRVGYVLDPFVNFLYAVPRIALFPLLIIWLGIGLTSKIALVFLVAVFPVLISTSSGIRSLDPQYLRTAICFGASDLQIFRTVALPGSIPFILSGIRLAVGQCLIGVFVAELLGAQHGIGMLMTTAGDQFQTATVFAGLLIFAVAGVLLTALVRRVERHFDAWRL